MIRLSLMLLVVTWMAIWPFSSASNAQSPKGDAAVSSSLSARIDALERQMERLEAKLERIEAGAKQGSNADGSDGARDRRQAAEPGGHTDQGACPGEWRRIGGGWTCYDPNAK